MRVIAAGLRGIPSVEGGIETHCQHLYPLLSERGCEIEVICRSPYSPASAPAQWRQIKRTVLWSPAKPALEAFLHTFLAVIYAARKRPDLLHLHAVGPALMVPVARLLGLKVVVTHHGFDYEREKWGKLVSYALRLGERLAAKYANRMIVITDVIKQRIRNLYQIESSLIPNGVDLPERIESTDTLSDHGLQKGRYFLMVVRFVPEKRIHDAIKAFRAAALPDWNLVVAGHNDADEAYSSNIRKLAGESAGVKLVGFQTGVALQELYTHAGALLLPSSHEGLPLTLLEALSHGIRVVISNIPAHTTLALPDECYFQLGDTEQLSHKLGQIACQEWSRDSALEQQRWVAERFSWEQIATDTLQAYNSAVSM